MTIEELKQHCVRQITEFERIKEIMPVTPNDYKHYEEHKIVLQLIEAFEQEPCEDCISRQAVKDIICSGVSIDTDADKEYVCELIDKLSSVTPKEKTGWIPVSERLPNECSGVLVYCPENKNIFLAYLEIGKWYIFSPNADEPIDEPIVAWMPLPKPYEPQESEKI